jgi:hypothetical protein
MATSATDIRINLTGRMKAITQGVVLIQIPKALVVLTREEFIAALQRGKAWRRREALEARQRPEENR